MTPGPVLHYARPGYREVPVPDFVEACLGASAVSAAEVGPDDGYLILGFQSAEEIRCLTPNGVAITAATRRALVATAPGEGTDEFVFRYFAPQYGDLEDMATGSAAVQLASWWTGQT